VSDPAFIKQLQTAVDRGQVVVIAPNANSAVPPLHQGALAARLALKFGLSHTEGRTLAHLLTHDCSTMKELCTVAATRGRQPPTTNTMWAYISSLRKKLKPYDIEIINVAKLGYGLTSKARDRIYQHLAKHDPGLVPENLEMNTG
jgi:hypothetical protein